MALAVLCTAGMGYIREIEIDAPLDTVWTAFTTANGLQHWLCERARVAPEKGGAFECYFGRDASRSTEGCTITEIEPQRHLAFLFRGTGEFADLFQNPANATEIGVHFTSLGGQRTRLVLEQSETRHAKGWAAYDEWAADAWEDALLGLKDYAETGTASVAGRQAFVG